MLQAPSRIAQVSLSLLCVAAITGGCSKASPPQEGAPAPKAISSLTSATTTTPAASAKRAPLLEPDPNWTRTERIARVLSVASCGKKDDQLCKRLTIKNEGKVDIAELVELRLCAYDGAGKPLGTNGYNYTPSKPVSIPAGATVTVDQLVSDDDKFGVARSLDGEVVIARLAGAPKGRHWVNTNLAADERPKGGFDTKALEARATLAVRATSFDPVSGMAHVRNDSKRTVTKASIAAYGWQHGKEGVLTKLGGLSFDMKLTPPLRPGEERDLDLSGGGKKDEYTKPGVVAHTVVALSVAYEDGVSVFNGNTEPNISERSAEDLKTAR